AVKVSVLFLGKIIRQIDVNHLLSRLEIMVTKYHGVKSFALAPGFNNFVEQWNIAIRCKIKIIGTGSLSLCFATNLSQNQIINYLLTIYILYSRVISLIVREFHRVVRNQPGIYIPRVFNFNKANTTIDIIFVYITDVISKSIFHPGNIPGKVFVVVYVLEFCVASTI